MGRHAVLAALALVSAAVALCDGCGDATAITVEISTDFPCDPRKPLDIGIAIAPLSQADQVAKRPFVATKSWCEPTAGRVGSLVLLPRDAEDDTVAIRVVGGLGRRAETCRDDGSACIVEDRLATFVENANVVVPFELSSSCIGVACVDGTTCSAHVCVPVPGAPSSRDGGPIAHDANADDGGVTLEASVVDAARTSDAATPRDASIPKEASTPPPPPPPCPQLPGTTACCGRLSCIGPVSSCTSSAQCNECLTKCGGDPQKVRCCVSATRVDKDGSPKVDCKKMNEQCPED